MMMHSNSIRKTVSTIAILVLFCSLLIDVPRVSPSVNNALQVSQRISALDWSPDGSLIAVGRPNGIDIVDANTRMPVQVLTGTTNGVVSVDWSPDGTKVAGASLDSGGVRVWDVATGQIVT